MKNKFPTDASKSRWKPENAEYYGWLAFCRFLKRRDILRIKGIAEPIWEVWKAGYIAAKND